MKPLLLSLASLCVLACVASAHQVSAQPAVPASDWPMLGHDATSSNRNPVDHALTRQTLVHIKVLWTHSLPTISYPIVSGGRVFAPTLTTKGVRVIEWDAATGKQITKIRREAIGGMVATDTDLVTAGSKLVASKLATGQVDFTSSALTGTARGQFLNPMLNGTTLLAPYVQFTTTASGRTRVQDRLFAVSALDWRSLWSVNGGSTAAPAASDSTVFTSAAHGSQFVELATGKRTTFKHYFATSWFSVGELAYGVTALPHELTTLYCLHPNGERVWSRVVAPPFATSTWPHAAAPGRVFVQVFEPVNGVQALDADTGKVIWTRVVPCVQHMAMANGLLYVASSCLAAPAVIVVLRATDGKQVARVPLPAGYMIYNADNQLMIAAGMLFVRAVGPLGPALLAFGTGK